MTGLPYPAKTVEPASGRILPDDRVGQEELGFGDGAIRPGGDLDREREAGLALSIGNLANRALGLLELRRSFWHGEPEGLDVVEQLHAHNMPNMGTPCNTKSAQPVLYTECAQSGHKKRMANNRIAELRKAKNMTQEELAELANTTVNNLGKLERGARRLNQDWLNRISEALDCDPSELIGKRNFTPPSGERAEPRPLDLKRAPDHMPTRGTRDDVGAVQLRSLNLELAMGDGTDLEDWIEESDVSFDANWLAAITATPADRLIIGRGVGDSMAPTIGDHDDVLIDLNETELNKLDRIWAITIDGAGAIKRLMPAGGGMVEVLSDNPQHPNRVRTYPREAVRIIGRVLWSGRRH